LRRTKEEAAATRELLLNTALTVFGSKGYAATTLDDIARAASVTRGAIYWHFGGKDELYTTLVRERFARASTIFESIFSQGGSPLQMLRLFMLRFLEYLEDDPEYRAVLELTIFKTEVGPDLASGMQEKQLANQAMIASIERLLREAIAAREVKSDIDVATAALVIMGFLSGITTLWLQSPFAFSLKARAHNLVDTFLNGLVTSS
jgi:TetR/AcrR family transcriptional regulator, acrAB operon repressor